MGKRSRKRGAASAEVSPTGTRRADRDAARARRAKAAARAGDSRAARAPRSGGGATRPARSTSARRRNRPSIDDRPLPPWGTFPLIEIVVFLAIVLFIVGVFMGGARGAALMGGALGLGSLAGLVTASREHFAGYRSHTTLLAGVCAFVVLATAFVVISGPAAAAGVPVAGVVFVVTWYFLREAFKRRSGGIGFR